MKQRTLAMTTGFERYGKKTKRAQFLEEMEQVVPWQKLCALIEPYYPKAGKGRHPVGVERMLRVYFLQQWFNLSDPGVEEALYDSVVMRQFAGIDLGREPVPDETTVCKFRHLLEEHGLGGEMLEAVNLHLQEKGVRITSGTIVDATIIHAPSSTKNREQKRDPQMHQTRKGNQWYFGMKAHVGVDSRTKIIHSAVATAASVADMHALLHGEETRVWGDQDYKGQTSVIQQCAPRARDCTHRQYRFKDRVDETERARNRTKSKVRSRVEHVFQIMKLKFGFVKVRYRGIRKNANRLFATCALVNLYASQNTAAFLRGLSTASPPVASSRLPLPSEPLDYSPHPYPHCRYISVNSSPPSYAVPVQSFLRNVRLHVTRADSERKTRCSHGSVFLWTDPVRDRSEEHTSELQSQSNL